MAAKGHGLTRHRPHRAVGAFTFGRRFRLSRPPQNFKLTTVVLLKLYITKYELNYVGYYDRQAVAQIGLRHLLPNLGVELIWITL